MSELEWFNRYTTWNSHRTEPLRRVHYCNSRGRGTLAQLLGYLAEEVGPGFNPEDITLAPGIVIWETEPTDQERAELAAWLTEQETKSREGRHRTYLKFKAEFEGEDLATMPREDVDAHSLMDPESA